jgi:hypothetical protein
MKVRVQGFTWELEGKPDATAFLTILEKIGPHYDEHDRILALTQRDGYWVGVLLTIRDQETICLLQQEGPRNFRVVTEALRANRKLVDFNFFLIHSDTARGLYMYYRGSSPLNTFCLVAKRLYDKMRREDRDAAIAATSDRKLQREIRGAYKHSLSYTRLLKKGSFDQLLSRLRSVRSFEVAFSALEVDDTTFRSLADRAKTIRQGFLFAEKRKHLPQLREAIRKFINSHDDIESAKVFGTDPEGNSETVDLVENAETLATFDYDQLVRSFELDSVDIKKAILNSNMVNQLIACAQSPATKAILKTPSK